MAKVVRFHQCGDPTVLQLDECEIGEPGDTEVRLRMEVIGLNRTEALFRDGEYGDPPFPAILGHEGAGVVEAIGCSVSDLKVGDRVATLPGLEPGPYGTYGETILFPAERLVKIPEGVSAELAAATWMQYLTAYSLISVGDIQPNEIVAITGASSSVGLAAIQIANVQDAVPVAITRGAGKAAQLRERGAAHVIISGQADITVELMKLTGGRGVRVIFDCVGGATLASLIEAAASEGVVIAYGWLGGGNGIVPIRTAVRKRLTVQGWSIRALVDRPEHRGLPIDYISKGLATGRLRPVIDRVFPLNEVAAAHAYLEQGDQFGKILLKVR